MSSDRGAATSLKSSSNRSPASDAGRSISGIAGRLVSEAYQSDVIIRRIHSRLLADPSSCVTLAVEIQM